MTTEKKRTNADWCLFSDIESHLLSLWERGVLQSKIIAGERGTEVSPFPLRLKASLPSSRDLSTRLGDVARWFESFKNEVASRDDMEIVWKDVRNAVSGKNRIPDKLFVPSKESLFSILGKKRAREFEKLSEMYDDTVAENPEVSEWLIRPSSMRTMTENASEWERIRAVLRWYRSHPFPDMYIREADIEGVDTKFVESRYGLLSTLLSMIVPPASGRDGPDGNGNEEVGGEDVSSGARDESSEDFREDERGDDEKRSGGPSTGKKGFLERFGFRTEHPMVRFRVFDAQGSSVLGHTFASPDIILSGLDFARVEPRGDVVFIVENKTVYLSFPETPHPSVVVYGGGYGGARSLRNASWLLGKRVFYWGDIDTHGFAILAGFRKYVPNIESFLMDEGTFLRFENLWTPEEHVSKYEPEGLTREETRFFRRMANGEFRCGDVSMRLEQERIGWGYSREKIFRVF